MAEHDEIAITKRSVDALSVEGKDAVFWDRRLPGFGVRVYPSGRKVYVVQSRGPGAPGGRRSAATARLSPNRRAGRRQPPSTASSQGEDPLPPPPAEPEPEPTMADLAERFMRQHAKASCKPSTVMDYKWTFDAHILLALGGVAVGALDRKHVAGSALRSPREAVHGQSGAGDAGQAVLAGRVLGPAGQGHQLVGSCAAIRNSSRAVPHARGVPAPRRGAGRGGDRWLSASLGGGGNPAADADQLPQGRVLGLKWDDVDRTAGECGRATARRAHAWCRCLPRWRRYWTRSPGFPAIPG